MPEQPTDDQLAAMIRHLARLHLEIERGQRAPEQLRPYMTPAAYLQLRSPTAPRFRDAPVQPDDLGSVHLTRLGSGTVNASVPTREQGQQHGALTMQLQATPSGKWRISELTRLDRQLATHPQTPSLPSDLETRLRQAEQERSAVATAHRVETRRAAETQGPAADRAKALAQLWQQRLIELDREHADLQRQRQHRDLTQPTTSPSRADETARSPVRRLLGDEPDDERARRLWQVAADEIHDYRDTWDIDDQHTALGPIPESAEQARHRNRIVELVRTVSPHLDTDRDTPDRASVALSR